MKGGVEAMTEEFGKARNLSLLVENSRMFCLKSGFLNSHMGKKNGHCKKKMTD